MTKIYSPLNSLREGHWFKLICGASFQHLPSIRDLTLAYTLAGVDCIDVAADPAVIASVKEALKTVEFFSQEAQQRGFSFRGLPLLMVSLNDGEDPHFRKAEFNATECPIECPRPCESICPAQAIVFDRKSDDGFSGVIDSRCYGCGRCLPVCPNNLIFARSYVSAPDAIAPLVLQAGVDALEIHTQVGRLADFQRLWQALAPWIKQLKLIAISCPDGEGLIDYLWQLYNAIKPISCPLIWQTDGRPMSGDIGAGTTHAAIKLGQKVLSAGLPGYVQLAGGTNSHTVTKLKANGLLTPQLGNQNINPMSHPQEYIAGIAYGSYARGLLSPILEEIEKIGLNSAVISGGLDKERKIAAEGNKASFHQQRLQPFRLEDKPELLWQAVKLADSLVSQLKLAKKYVL